MVDEKEVRRIHGLLKSGAEEMDHYFNPDEQHTMRLVESLLTNKDRYGYMSCPCRLADGVYEKDRDIVCPCDYRDPDIKEYGTCYCALYVSKEVRDKKLPVGSIPERRKKA